MPRLTFAGHPVHPQMVSAPLGLLPMSLALDVCYLATRRRSYAEASYYTMLGGYVGALSAAMTGLGDYFAIPDGSPTKRIANVHLTLNVGIIGIASLGLMRRRGKRRVDGGDVMLSAIGNAALMVSGWYGGQMVYKQGMRVEGRSEVARAPEWRVPGDDKIEHALAAVADAGGDDGRGPGALREDMYGERNRF